MIDKPGVYDIPAEQYHLDPCPQPSLSASVAAVLLEQSPAHARAIHPKLNPNYQAENRREFDLGAAVHALFLRDTAVKFVIVEAGDYRSSAARVARDDAYAAGAIPLLPHQYETVVAAAKAAREQLATFSDEARDLFADGKAEQTLIWQDGPGLWCRARPDWLPNKIIRNTIIPDLKTEGASAEPASWIRRKLTAMSYDLQAAFYLRGIRKLFNVETVRFADVVIELEPPNGLSVIGMSPAVLQLAEQKADHAIALWGRCLETGAWPSYPSRICWAEPAPWDEARWMERMARDPKPTPAKLKEAMEWQRPIERTGA